MPLFGYSKNKTAISAWLVAAGAMKTAPQHKEKRPYTGDSCVPDEQDFSKYLGSYHIFSVARVTGGLTSEAEIQRESAAPIVISEDMYRSGWMKKEIVSPRYAMSCYPESSGDGGVAPVIWNAHWSDFYGLSSDRKVIKVLEIHNSQAIDETPYTWFEIVTTGDNVQLWGQRDGWVLKMTRTDPSRSAKPSN